MKTALLIIVIIGLAFLLLVFYSRQKLKNMSVVEADASILTLNDKNFNQQLRGKLILVDFWAAWCAPCKMMLPILNDVASASDGSFAVGKLDVDANQGIAAKYGIRSIPTLIVFRDGKEVARYSGIKTKAFLLSELKKL